MDNKSTSESLDLFGNLDDAKPNPSPAEIDETVSDALSMGGLGVQVDPDMADEICAEIVSASELHLIRP